MREDSQGREGDPLSFGDLDSNDIFLIYGWGHGGSGMWGDLKGQGNGNRGVGGLLPSFNLVQVETLFSSSEEEEDLMEGKVEDVTWELLQVVVEGVGVKQFEDQSRQEGEGGAKGQAKQIGYVIWACFEVLDLGKGNMMEELNKDLTGDILLVAGKSLNSNKDGGGSDDKGIESMDAWCWEETNKDGLRVGWGQVERFV